MNLQKTARLYLILFAAALIAAGGAGLSRERVYANQAAPTITPAAPAVTLLSPNGGEALQGAVSIQGSTAVEGFQSAELAFAYQADRTGTWFLLWQSRQPSPEGWLSTWDTTTITDGTYRLRLQVMLADGSVLEQTVEGLRVRNYSPVETSTPGAIPTEAAVGSARPTSTPSPTPAADYRPAAGVDTVQGRRLDPTNPAQITVEDLRDSALTSALAVLGAMLLFGLLLGLRAAGRR